MEEDAAESIGGRSDPSVYISTDDYEDLKEDAAESVDCRSDPSVYLSLADYEDVEENAAESFGDRSDPSIYLSVDDYEDLKEDAHVSLQKEMSRFSPMDMCVLNFYVGQVYAIIFFFKALLSGYMAT